MREGAGRGGQVPSLVVLLKKGSIPTTFLRSHLNPNLNKNPTVLLSLNPYSTA